MTDNYLYIIGGLVILSTGLMLGRSLRAFRQTRSAVTTLPSTIPQQGTTEGLSLAQYNLVNPVKPKKLPEFSQERTQALLIHQEQREKIRLENLRIKQDSELSEPYRLSMLQLKPPGESISILYINPMYKTNPLMGKVHITHPKVLEMLSSIVDIEKASKTDPKLSEQWELAKMDHFHSSLFPHFHLGNLQLICDTVSDLVPSDNYKTYLFLESLSYTAKVCSSMLDFINDYRSLPISHWMDFRQHVKTMLTEIKISHICYSASKRKITGHPVFETLFEGTLTAKSSENKSHLIETLPSHKGTLVRRNTSTTITSEDIDIL